MESFENTCTPLRGARFQEMAEVLREISKEVGQRVRGDLAQALEIDAILHPDNIREAIRSLKGHTTPGPDGIPVDVYKEFQSDDDIIEHLIKLYRGILRDGRMPEDMRTAIVSMIYKNKGDRSGRQAGGSGWGE